jgi:hypothetical protein
MKQKTKIFVLATVVCSIFLIKTHAADIQWNPNTTYTIPADGNTYYIDFTKTITADLEVPTGATLELRTSGQINISNSNYLIVSGGTFDMVNGEIWLGSGDIGNISITDGIFNITSGNIYNGRLSDSTGNIVVSGGTLNLSGAGGTIHNGFGAGATTGNITVSSGTFKLGGGSISLGSGASNINIFGANINNTAIPSGSMPIPSGQIMSLASGNSFIVDTGGTLTNNGTIILTFNSILNYDNGTFVNNGELIDFSSTTIAVDESTIVTIPSGTTIPIDQSQILNVNGLFRNLSSSSIDIYGTVYTYSLIENGGATAGTINIHHPGSLYLLGGTLENNHANSVVNVNQGGSFYSYHGTVDLTTGGADSLVINAGGKFDNVRGNNPETFTINTGGNFSDNNEINLDQNLDIDYTWTITDQATINGYGNKITFSTNGAIVLLGSNASLALEDVIIENVSGNQIRCTDDTTSLTINNVIWTQDADYTFTKGKISVEGDVLITGANTIFGYSSNQTSTIQQYANLIFDHDVTFSYDSTANNRINMVDSTAELTFMGATLQASEDVRFIKGKLVFNDVATFTISSGKTVYLGNSTATDNINLKYHNNSRFIVAGSGSLVNQNV